MHFQEGVIILLEENLDWLKPSPRTITETSRGWSPFRLPGTRSKPHAYCQMVTHPWTLLHLSNREYTNCNWRVEYENEMTPWNQDDGQLGDLSRIYHTSLFLKYSFRFNAYCQGIICAPSISVPDNCGSKKKKKKEKKRWSGGCNFLWINKINVKENHFIWV